MQFGVSESIVHWGKYRPNNVAAYSNGKIYTYKLLNEYIEKLSTYLISKKIKNNRIGILIKNKFFFLIALGAILRINKSAVILNSGLSPENLKVNLFDTEICDIIFDNEELLKKLSLQNNGNKLNISNFDFSDPIKFPSTITETNLPDDEWGILFSSGTTGAPKGISRDHYSIVTENIGWCLELGLNKYTKYYIGRPLFYTGGLVLTLSTLLVGGAVVINDLDDENDFHKIWKDYQISLSEIGDLDWAFFIPDQIRAFIKIVEIETVEFKFANNILTMGAPISGKEKLKAHEILKSNIIESWGNSESLGTITEPEDLKIRPDSIGRPFLTDEMYILDENDDNISTPKIIGRISGHSEAGFKEYTNRQEATDQVLRNEKIISEDLGYFDSSGYFYIESRVQDLIIIGGTNVFLTKIEKKIRDQLGIQNINISYKDVVGSNPLIFLFVESDEVTTLKNLHDRVNEILNEFEKIHKVIVLEKLPRLPNGKVDKNKLKKKIQNYG